MQMRKLYVINLDAVLYCCSVAELEVAACVEQRVVAGTFWCGGSGSISLQLADADMHGRRWPKMRPAFSKTTTTGQG